MQALIAILFLAVLGVTTVSGPLPPIVIGLYITASLATFLLYARDKQAAERNQWRIRERTLHACALVGGWPGALMAQTIFRHKSRKPSFRAILWITVMLHCAALAALLWPLFNT